MRYLLLYLVLVLTAPFAAGQKPADDKTSVGGLLGTWEYTLRQEDPMAQGTFLLEMGDGQINGMFNTDAPRKMENIEMTDSSLSFTIRQPGMGLIAIVFAVDGDGLEGTASPEGAEEPLPIIAVRLDEGETPSKD